VRKRYGRKVRIESLKLHRTKPAIIDDKHARTALALAYAGYAQKIISDIKDDILKRNLTDFKRINKYDEILSEYENRTPDFIDQNDIDAIEAWRKTEIEKRLKSLNYIDRYGKMTRSLKRDIRIRENIYKNVFKNIAATLIIWDMFRYYMTTSNNARKINISPFPYIRVELDREQRKVFQITYRKVIEILTDFTDIKIIAIPEMDLLLYDKFKFEKEMKNTHIKFNHVALGAALINQNSDIDLETISNAFNINESRINKEIKHIDQIKNPRSDRSQQFLDLIKKG
jgi:Zn-finger domain-containing protein